MLLSYAENLLRTSPEWVGGYLEKRLGCAWLSFPVIGNNGFVRKKESMSVNFVTRASIENSPTGYNGRGVFIQFMLLPALRGQQE